jgi:peptidoglycan/LPS O-acetylase OafA/YrhL
MNERNHGLDLMRATAITLVLILHIGDAIYLPRFLDQVSNIGWSGVDLFFVLSGFLISSQIIDKTKFDRYDLKSFWIKRWTRTFPLYYITLLFYIMVKPLVFHKPFNDSVFKYFFFLQNLSAPKDFVQSWSLCIEEHFYLFLPLIFLCCIKWARSTSFYLCIIAFSISCRWYIVSNHTVKGEPLLSYLINFPTYSHLDGLAMGVILALTKKQWVVFSNMVKRLFFVSGLVIFFGYLFVTYPFGLGIFIIWQNFILALGATFILIGLYQIKIPTIIYIVIYQISLTSYGMYLWNNSVIKVIETYLNEWHWLAQSFLMLALTFGISWVTYQMIEKPGLKLRNKLLN